MENSITQYNILCDYASYMLTEEEHAIFVGELFKRFQKGLFYIVDNKLWAKWNTEDKLGYNICV